MPPTSYSSWFSYCPHCSTKLASIIKEGSPRRKCPHCHWIQYRNPTVGVAVVVVQQRQLLIGRRRDGGWCIPCGHVEWDESIEQAARREFAEETGLEVVLRGIQAVKSNFHTAESQTVGIWFRGVSTGGELRPGGDLLEVQFVALADMRELKFETDREVVQDLRSLG